MQNLESKNVTFCDCHSTEHQLVSYYDKESNEVYIEVHLISYRNIFKRIWVAVKYIFGYKSKWGNWDVFIFSKSNYKIIFNQLNQIKKNGKATN